MKDITITISAKAIAVCIEEYNELLRKVRPFDARNDSDDVIVYQDALELYLECLGLAPVFEPEDDLEDANEVLIDIIQAWEA